jgi:predicted GIY-YIG superfamily endonuclease
VRLAYFEEVEDRKAAMKREIAIKRLPHEKKKRLAEEFPREQLPNPE